MIDQKSTAAERYLSSRDPKPSTLLYQGFASFLLDSVGVNQFPVHLDQILEKQGITRQNGSLLGQRGMLLGNAMIINGDDPISVQRFTVAHELMETLTVALRAQLFARFSRTDKMRFEKDKENWCEQGAAWLLMPDQLFRPLVKARGISMESGRQIARICQASMTAVLRRMLETDLSPCFFALLHQNNKKHQVVPSKTGQMPLWGEVEEWDPQAELRVWRWWASPHVNIRLIYNESFPRESLAGWVYACGQNGNIHIQREVLDLEQIKGPHEIEATAVTINGERCVMVLGHL